MYRFQMKKFEGSQGSRKLDLFAMIMIIMMNTQTYHHGHLWADGVHHDGDLLSKRCLPGQPGHQGIWAFCLTSFSRQRKCCFIILCSWSAQGILGICLTKLFLCVCNSISFWQRAIKVTFCAKAKAAQPDRSSFNLSTARLGNRYS